MGYITLTNGEMVHTSSLNPNPEIRRIILSEKWGEKKYLITFKDGTTTIITETYSTHFK